MPQRVDHLVLPVHDLAAAASQYARLGFQVGPRNTHPWGTQNHIVQLHGTFLELIGLADGVVPGQIHPAPEQYSFAGFVGKYLGIRQGIAMLVLRSPSAVADAHRFAAEGIGSFQPFNFGRAATQPDGSKRDVFFSLAFAESALLPEIGFFTCENHFPEHFWRNEAKVHANSAATLRGIVIIAENPAEHAEFMAKFLGQRLMLSTSMGLTIETGDETVEILTPLAARYHYGDSVCGLELKTPLIVACRITVGDLDTTRQFLSRGGVSPKVHGSKLIVTPEDACGATIIFEPQVSDE